MDDGILHTVVVKSMGRMTFARLFGPYSDGKAASYPDLVRVSTARTVRIRGEEDIVTCLDGECFRSRGVVMGLAEKRLNFFGPKGCSPNATAR